MSKEIDYRTDLFTYIDYLKRLCEEYYKASKIPGYEKVFDELVLIDEITPGLRKYFEELVLRFKDYTGNSHHMYLAARIFDILQGNIIPFQPIKWEEWCPYIEKCNGKYIDEIEQDPSVPCSEFGPPCWLYTNIYSKIKNLPVNTPGICSPDERGFKSHVARGRDEGDTKGKETVEIPKEFWKTVTKEFGKWKKDQE